MLSVTSCLSCLCYAHEFCYVVLLPLLSVHWFNCPMLSVILVYLIVACLFSLPVFAVLCSFVVNGMVMLILCLPRHVFGFSFETWISFVWFVWFVSLN